MKEVFTFYRAVDPMKGSWDGYGYFPSGTDDFVAFVADAPSGASIHTPELIKEFWKTFSEKDAAPEFPNFELADALNRLQNDFQKRGRRENILYQATIAIAWKSGTRLFLCCIGDSSLHVFRGGKLYRLSESEVWDGASITGPGRVLQERQKTTELQFIGSNGSFVQSSRVQSIDLKPEDVLIFTTDGVEDLLPPDRLLTILKKEEQMRQQLETIFAQDKVKDDATLLMVPVRVNIRFDAEKEFAAVRSQLEKMQKEQKEMRGQLLDFAQTRIRLEKIETTLTQMSQDVKRVAKRSQPAFHNAPSAVSGGVSARKTKRLPWLIPLLCVLAGTAAGAFLFREKGALDTPQQTAQRSRPPVTRPVAPPEIPSTADCSYTIQKGDSLDKIATARSVTVDQLLEWNPSQKKDGPLMIGKTLIVCQENP